MAEDAFCGWIQGGRPGRCFDRKRQLHRGYGIVAGYGTVPIVYLSHYFVEAIRQVEPERLDAVIDGIMAWFRLAKWCWSAA